MTSGASKDWSPEAMNALEGASRGQFCAKRGVGGLIRGVRKVKRGAKDVTRDLRNVKREVKRSTEGSKGQRAQGALDALRQRSRSTSRLECGAHALGGSINSLAGFRHEQ